MLQILKQCVANAQLLCRKYNNTYVANIDIYVFYKYGANGSMPAGAFFTGKLAPSMF